MNINSFNDIVDCFFYGIFIKNNSASYDTSSSSSCKGGIEDNLLGSSYIKVLNNPR